MKKNILLLVCTGVICCGAFANTVTMQEAQTIAQTFFKITTANAQTRTPLTATLKYTRTEADNIVDFYAFDMSPIKGFVIVAATDNDVPIIGYSTESYFPTDFSKIGMNELLNRWSTELHYVILNNVIATPKAVEKWSAYRQGVAPVNEKSGSVAPFCLTKWDQYNESGTTPALYNNYCPGTGANQAVTGCVATTMAQIMRYWKYPATGTGGSHSYQDATSLGYQMDYGTLSFNYSATTFDWTNMPIPGLTNSSSAAQINAVGTLMYAAGVSVEMDYSPNGSGAVVITSEAGGGANAQNAYVQYFGYQNIIHGLLLTSTTTAKFIDSIEADLNAGHLVQIQGTDPTNGGHTWVCDGYDANNNFHMNWGWSGYSDGYFAVTSMNPNDGQSVLTFSNDIGALLHIMPPSTASINEQAVATLNTICAGTSTTLNATTHHNATYSWTPTTGLTCATCASTAAAPTTNTTYTVTADSAGIRATSTVTVTVHPAPTATIPTSANVSCFGAANGSATVSVSGGTGGYRYAWSNSQTGATATNLSPGNYSVTVSDLYNCSSTATKTITQPASALSASTNNPVNATCGQANGSVSVSASGGTSAYHYLWSNGATTTTASNLSGATYTVTVTDAHSCTITASATISSTGTLNLVTNATNVTCFGSANGSAVATVTGSIGSVSYHWSNGATTPTIQNVGPATYNVTITDGSGCSATSSKVVSEPAALSLSVNAGNAGCGNTATGTISADVTGGTSGYAYHWSNGSTTSFVSGLAAGNYEVTVTDAHSCSTSSSAVISAASPISVIASSANATCYGSLNGSASVSVTGSAGGLNYTWSNGATTSAINNVAAGSYSVTISDVNNCTAATNVAVVQPNQIQVTTTAVNVTGAQDDGSASVSNVVGATAPYSYVWSNGATSQTISNIGPGNYTVTVTDAHGCSQTASDFVNVSTGLAAINSAITFNMYPNPAGTHVLVQLDGFNNSTTLSLKNILGQTVISQMVTALQTQVDLKSLANGVYLVELRQDEKVAVKQLVVVK